MDSGVPNLGPNIIAALWTYTPLAFIFLSLRLFCKLYKRAFPWWDDFFLTIYWCILLACNILVTIDVRDGFGKHTVDRDYIVGFMAPLAIAWSKSSFALSLLRITEGTSKVIVIRAIIVSTNLLLIMAAFSFFFQCTPVEKLWNPMIPGTCLPSINTVVGVLASAYSGFMHFVLALLACTTIWKLNLVRKEKVGVAIAMSMGIL
ncbi:hypothetical protein F4677DRAFT_459725 [Hypoxylon crocopeplum]|nr:hypothetical protein F4677DRAFT_459725 [Hypoxylon crocopeplum]